MKRKAHFLVMLSIIVLGACTAGRTEWQTFTSKAGNFSVSMPGVPLESVTISQLQVGRTESHVFTLHHGAYGYAFAYTAYPIPGAADANPLGALEGEMRRTLDSVGATLITQHDIFLDDALGIAFQGKFMGGRDFDTPGMVYGRVYLLNARLYQLMVVAAKDQVRTAEPERFLASFRWLKVNEQDTKVSR